MLVLAFIASTVFGPLRSSLPSTGFEFEYSFELAQYCLKVV